MAHTHENDCIVCGAHFDTLKELDKHNHEQHLRKSIGAEHPRQEEPPKDDDERSNRQQF